MKEGTYGPLKQHDKYAQLEKQYDMALDSFLKDVGLHISDKTLLKIALSEPNYYAELSKTFDTVKERSAANEDVIRRDLEIKGDHILNKRIREWCSVNKRDFLLNFMRSNAAFSRVALSINLNSVVRIGAKYQQDQPKTRLGIVRNLANAFERFAAVVVYDTKEGTDALQALLDTYLFEETFFLEVVPKLFSPSLIEINEALRQITGGLASFDVEEDKGKYRATITMHNEVKVSITGGTSQQASAAGIQLFLTKNPWFLWGHKGPMHVYYPEASALRKANE
jgi:hypothetical protein